GYRYRVIFIQRNMDEMLASQKKMLVRRGEDPDRISDSEMRDLFNKTVKDLKNNLALRNDISVLYVSYNDIMKNPQPHIDAIDKFMGGWMDKDKMKAVVDARLYRNRAQ
ncbi:MAG TPA: sulfotransferase family protein, partial [Euryarchaeota archaeon]|nr:sulfotransferase family protein [Euryarchaeota archaeon]